MSEQEREPAPADEGASELPASQEGDRIHQATPTGGIHAEMITQTTNVVSGEQHIGTQINYGSSRPRHVRTPPLQRPRRSEHFVDREGERARLLADLKLGRVVTVCGLGGMGKTALVAEVLWTLAPAETLPPTFPDGILFYSFYEQPAVEIALEQLARSLGEEPGPTAALAAQRALSGKRILLVLDGAEEADHLGQVLSICGDSAVLVTSRSRADAPDSAYRLDLQPLAEQEAVNVVQAFGGVQAVDVTSTSRICACVGNLPLALRLVGRYLAQQEEEAGEYLAWLEQTPLSALDQGTSRQESVPVLLERSIMELSVTAQQVLHLCGLLAPTAFDRLLIAQTLELSEDVARRALGELVNYGLLVRQKSRYEVSHPLIHTYARQRMETRDDHVAQRTLLERIVRVVDEQFTEMENMKQFVGVLDKKQRSERENAGERLYKEFFPHVQVCATLIAQHQLIFPEAGYLLAKAGRYLMGKLEQTHAVYLLQQALTIMERSLGSDHWDIGVILNDLANLYQGQGRYEEAESLYQRALTIDEKTLPPDHPDAASILNNLACLYWVQGRYEEAEPLLLRVLAIDEKTLPPDHSAPYPDPAVQGWTLTYIFERGAITLYPLILAIDEKTLPPHYRDTASILKDLANLYQGQGRFEEAESLLLRVLTIDEKTLPPDHGYIASTLRSLADLYWVQGRYEEAESLLLRVLTIDEKTLPPDHGYIASTLRSLADLYWAQGRYEEAEPLLLRVLAIDEKTLPPDHGYIASTLRSLAWLYQVQGRYEEAEPLYQRVLAMDEKAPPPAHRDTATTLRSLADLYRTQRRYEEAEPLYQRTLDSGHPDWTPRTVINAGNREASVIVSLRGAAELEAFITMKGDDPALDHAVRRRVVEAQVLVLCEPVQGSSGTAHVLHCTVPVGDTTIAMLPVFTRVEHVVTAVQMNPAWQSLQVLQMESSVVLEDLEEGEWLGINPWSGHEYKLPPIPSTNLPPADYSRAIDLDPNNARNYNDRGFTYYTLKEYERALADFSRVIDLDPTYVAAYNNRGFTYSYLKEYERALADLSRAIDLDPTYVMAYTNRGKVYLWQRNIAQAKADFARAVEIDPTYSLAALLFEWSSLSKQRGGIDMAERFEEIASIKPQESQEYIVLVCQAIALELRNKLEESLEEIDKAITLMPEKEFPYFWKGILSAYHTTPSDAIESIQQALVLGLPPILLTPLYWLEHDSPDWFSQYARPLLDQYGV